MSIGALDMGLYALALLVLFLTPGPVWLALMARSMSGGYAAAWPLAVGVAIGDILWPLLAILGARWIVTEFDNLLAVMRIVACLIFVGLGVTLIRNASARIQSNAALTRPGRLAGFVAGLVAIVSNPKAILFYMGVLPGFFDLTTVGPVDIAAIVGLSATVPLLGNLAFAALIGRLRRFLTSPEGLRRTNLLAGGLLIAVGLILPFT